MIFIDFIIPNYDLRAHKLQNIINTLVLHCNIFTFQSVQIRDKGAANGASVLWRQHL